MADDKSGMPEQMIREAPETYGASGWKAPVPAPKPATTTPVSQGKPVPKK